MRVFLSLILLVPAVVVGQTRSASAAELHVHEFTRMIAHLAGPREPGYLEFVAEAKPELAQFGHYGAHFWGLVHTPFFGGYPAQFPVQGHKECRAWQKETNDALHKMGVKVVGHLNTKFLVGDLDGPDGPTGFFKFYRDLWDESVLGPKPAADITTMLEVDKDGKPIGQTGYAIGKMYEYWACLNNPDWRKVLKAFIRAGVDNGADGFIANYFYRHDCHCQHCVAGFKKHLSDRYNADQLKEKFAISNLPAHKFDEIVCWHKPDESTPLRREMLEWSQVANKRAFDDVFIDYGRSLKPDLITAQWNHLSYFSQISGDERCMIPADLWGKGEDYLWYSDGASGCFSDIQNHYLGEGTLQARYIRGSFDDKPFTLGKYEHTRIRVSIAELAANGGAGMGLYARYTDPEAREVFVKYFGFMRGIDDALKANRSHAEVCLLYPRTGVHERADVAAVKKFKLFGEKLLDDHVLFDVRPDDLPPPPSDQYAAVIDVTKCDLVELPKLLPKKRTTSDLPFTVRLSASVPEKGGELTLHLVNYNRTEPARQRSLKKDADPKNPEYEYKPSTGSGTIDEKPIAAPTSKIQLLVPAGVKLGDATAHSPEWDAPKKLTTTVNRDVVTIEVPEFLVYCVVRLPHEAK